LCLLRICIGAVSGRLNHLDILINAAFELHLKRLCAQSSRQPHRRRDSSVLSQLEFAVEGLIVNGNLTTEAAD
jgi:hypothetical protein